ncbi:MAG: VWA domain-containing protein [Labilithrix sp.]|nr:VWA domain-containing protein [Labilithrix sp.]
MKTVVRLAALGIPALSCVLLAGGTVGCSKRSAQEASVAPRGNQPASAVAHADEPAAPPPAASAYGPTDGVAAPAAVPPVAVATAPMPAATAVPPPPAMDGAKDKDEEARPRKPSAPRAVAKAGRAVDSKGDPWSADDARPMPGGAFGVSNQFAGVKAGEWDDNANFREFQRFLASSPTGHRRMNLNDRRFIVVRDKNGHGVPRCKVTVRDARQASASFVTTASGRAILFPHAEGLTGDKLSATATCAEGSADATFATFDGQDGLVDLKLATERAPLGTRVVDLAFILDTTGSMSEEITAVKATIQKVAKVLSTEQTTVRVGLVEYKDRQDAFVTKVYPFATDLAGFAQRVSTINASGGGDMPEDMNAGLHTAMTELAWSDRSVARMAFVIADAPPHLDYQDGPDYANDMKTASHRGIQLFTVAASGMDALGQVVFRQMAQYTGGTNMFVLRGGAGPESTGGGDPASSCGGTHTNYSSGKLDELIVQKIRRELKALDADPMRIAGLKTDENAKPCNERVVFLD